ncbi:Ig-like domain-containing protein [Magnetococcus sp. PR-3]|uniref:Ig-like domain-containing protein n=1 Tax=Magnetococcus sp. PR-3 TaxID=3120355 RepID=UPI002FCE222D
MSKHYRTKPLRNRAVALEPRTLFDGAAMLDVMVTLDSAADVADEAAQEPAISESDRDALTLVGLDPENQTLLDAGKKATESVEAFVLNASQEQLFALFNGGKDQPDDVWQANLQQIQDEIRSGTFQLQVATMESVSHSTAVAAFAAEGLNGEPTILLHQGWVNLLGESEMTAFLAEEIGHALDHRLNNGVDTAGDEGALFAAQILGDTLDSAAMTDLALEKDHGQVVVDGRSVDVEFASYQFSAAYAMYPTDSRHLAEKEQETDRFIGTKLGATTINDGSSQGSFSGNDVVVQLDVDGNTYYGWISRPIKSKGDVKGFYFWYDTDWTSFSDAVNDGNQDGDRDASDNRAILLVVDDSYFQGVISGGQETTADGTTVILQTNASGAVYAGYAPAAGASVYEVGSSSDRVDSALNSILPTNAAPTAVNDSVTTNATGTAAGNLISGTISTGTGTGGTDSDGDGDSLRVVNYTLEGTTYMMPLSGSQSATVSGVGTFTISSDGSYTFTTSNGYTGSVPALTYVIGDDRGGVASANLTVTASAGDTTAPTVAITTDDSSLNVGDTATLTFTLSEASTDFTQSDVTVTGGTLSHWTAVSSTVYTATFTPASGSTTDGVVHVASSKFADSAGNQNADGADADNTVTMSVDTVRPVIAITSDATTLKAGETATMTFTLSEASSDFIESDVTVTGGTLSNWTAVSSTVYTATFTPSTDSTTSGVVRVDSSKFSDASGNQNADGADANNQVTMGVDTLLPTIAIATDDAALNVGDTATVTFTLSEASSDFAESDVTITGGALSNWTAVSSTVYTATFTPTDGSTADGVVHVASSTFSDSAGNQNADGSEANNTATMTVDTVRPTVAITTDDSALNVGDTATVTFTLSEASTDFVQSDVTVTGGALSNWAAVSSSVYTATFTPSSGSTTDGVVHVASSKFSDAAGNQNTDGSDADNTVTMTVDTIPPTIAITTDDGMLNSGDTATVTFTLSEASTDFVQSDTTVTGGALSNWTAVSSTVYTATFTPTDGSTTDGVVHVASSKFSDSAGNQNADGSDADNTVTMSVDTVLPTVAITTDDSALNSGDSATVTFTLSEASTDFVQSDATVTGGTLSNWTAVSSSVYTATFTPSSGSTTDGVVHVASSKFSDAAGNQNADGSDADNTVTMTVDTVLPTIAITTDDTALNAGDTAVVTFTLSEASSDFVQSDVTVTGGALSGWTATSSTVYTATFTPTDSSTTDGVVRVDSSKFADSAGNQNADGADADNQVTMTVDTVLPTIAVTTNDSTLTYGETATLTFALSESSTDFVASDITVTGGTLSNFTGSGSSYTATFTPTDNSTTDGVVRVDSSKFSDAAGNQNADGTDANNQVTMTVDTALPTIAITTSDANLTTGETATLTFTLSESSSDFAESDVTVTGGTLSNFSGSGTAYTATFTPTASSTTDGVVHVASSKFTDGAGNQNADGSDADNTVTMGVNTSVFPAIAITTSDANLKSGETAAITFNLTESSTDFVESDISVTGGALSNFSGSGTAYTATFTPDGSATGTVHVASSTFSNSLSVQNQDGADANNTVTMNVDTTLPTIAITTDDTALNVGDSATVTFTLSEDSSDFAQSDVTITGGALSNWTAVSNSVYTATFTPTSDSTTNGVVHVASSTFSDAAGNQNADESDADNTVTMTVDTVRPTIAIASDDSALIAGETATLTFTLSESSSDFAESDVTVTGGSLSNFSGSGTSYTATFTPTTSSTTDGVVRVDSSKFADSAGNQNADGDDANNQVTMTVDTIVPTIAITTDDTALTVGETATVTFTLSEASSNFVESDVTVTGGTLANWTALSSTVYTATFTPSSDSTTDGVVHVASSKFSDSAGNQNADGTDADNTVTMTVDTVRPTIAITTDDSALIHGETATLTFTLSEAATDFVQSDVTVTGGALSNWTGVSSTVYTATFTPTSGSTTDGVVHVASSKFSDASGNQNDDGADANNTVTMTVDTILPTIAISTDDTALNVGDTATLTFTLSETSTDFVQGDITVTGGALSNFSGSGTSYTATFTPTDASTTNGVVRVDSAKFSDAAGNSNADGADANNEVTMTVDTVRPTIAITTDDATLNVGDSATVTFTLSENASDFTQEDVVVTGGTLSNWSAVSNSVYTATFTPSSGSTTDGVVYVASSKFSDGAGNQNADGSDADNTVTMTVDTILPTIAITTDDAALNFGDTATVTFTLSEASTDFVEADVTVTGGALSNWTAVSSSVYTATFTPTASSTTDGVVRVDSAKFSDGVGNQNADGADTNNQVTMTVDTILPTIAITTDDASLTTGETATVTFTLSEAASDFVEGDVTITGGSLSNWSAVSDTVYTATFTPTTGSTTDGVVHVASSKFTDATGNANADGADADNTVTMSVDTRTLEITTHGPVNEASQYAMFTITAVEGYALDLTLQNSSSGTQATWSGFTGMEFSTDGGTSWTTYSANAKPSVPASGTVNVRVDISSEADTTYEGSENFALQAAYSTNTTINDDISNSIIDDGTGTIYDGSMSSGTPGSSTSNLDDDRPSFAIDDITRNEGAGSITFTVTKSGNTNLASTVQYSTADGTADAGSTTANDYSAVSGTLNFAAGDTTKTITTNIWNDARYEVSEQFNVNLFNASGATISDAQGIGEIRDDGTGSGGTNDDSTTVGVRSFTPVNEAADWAMFVVEGTSGQQLDLTVADGTTTLDLTNLTVQFSYDGSTWQTYGSSNKPTIPSNTAPVYVRVDITSEQDTPFEDAESFTLTATDVNNAGTTDTAKTIIVDDGSGVIYGPNFTSGVPGETTTGLDDDRGLTVSGYGPVSEGSTYAMFTVDALPGFEVDLAISNGTTALSSSALIEYSTDGVTWESYDAQHKPKIDGSGTATQTFYARVTITSEQDNVFEKSENFSLVANYSNNTTKQASAQTSIVDEYNGTIYGPNFASGTPATSTTNLDDDRPVSVTPFGPINENSTYGMFTVTALSGYGLDLSVVDGTTTLDPKAQVDFSYSGSSWTIYSANSKPTVPTGGQFNVRVDISSEDDDLYEISENFSLQAAYSDHTSNNALGQSSIVDDATGLIYGPNMPGGKPETKDRGLDDDRPGRSDTSAGAPLPPPEPDLGQRAGPSEAAFVLDAVAEAREELNAAQLADSIAAEAQAVINRLSGDLALHVLPTVEASRQDTIATFQRIMGDGSNGFVESNVDSSTIFNAQSVVPAAAPAAATLGGAPIAGAAPFGAGAEGGIEGAEPQAPEAFFGEEIELEEGGAAGEQAPAFPEVGEDGQQAAILNFQGFGEQLMQAGRTERVSEQAQDVASLLAAIEPQPNDNMTEQSI